MDASAHVRVGPAGWSYDDWKGFVYPLGMPRSSHPLTFLARYFDTVEVNSTFYRPPDAKSCAGWLRRVEENPRFKFTFKLWRRFTHDLEWGPSTRPGIEDVRVVKEGLAPVADAGRLGALLVQFPWGFRRTPEARAWLAGLLDAFAEYPLALEVRHASWNRPELFEGLSQRGVAFCNIDQPLFRDSLGPTGHVTARVGYVRLHGRNAADWFREDAGRDERYDYLYSLDELSDWLSKIERIRARADEVYVITNNHYRGQAVVNAFELLDGLGQPPAGVPEPLRSAYPRLQRFPSHEGGSA